MSQQHALRTLRIAATLTEAVGFTIGSIPDRNRLIVGTPSAFVTKSMNGDPVRFALADSDLERLMDYVHDWDALDRQGNPVRCTRQGLSVVLRTYPAVRALLADEIRALTSGEQRHG